MARVPVVEDDQFVRSALIRHLTDAAHTVRSVGTVVEALREVVHFPFDMVIMDLGLPGLDGSEALRMLRGITDVPVVVATARDDGGEIVHLLNAGADDCLTKPFSAEHLSARAAAVLRPPPPDADAAVRKPGRASTTEAADGATLLQPVALGSGRSPSSRCSSPGPR